MRNKKKNRAFNLEQLEPRAFMDASASVSHSVMNITGTPGDDVIVVLMATSSNFYPQVTINGQVLLAGSDFARRVRVDAGDGNDSVTIILSSDNTLPTPSTLIFGGNGNDSLTGGNENDRLVGGAGNDLLIGNGGDDTLVGGDGDDTLVGGDGDDRIFGGAGDDLLFDTDEHNTFLPGGGIDRIYASRPHNFIKLNPHDTLTEPGVPAVLPPGPTPVIENQLPNAIDPSIDLLSPIDEAALRQQITDAALARWDTRFGTTQAAYYEAFPLNVSVTQNPGPHAVTDGRYVYSLQSSTNSNGIDLVVSVGDILPTDSGWPDSLSVYFPSPPGFFPLPPEIARLHLDVANPVINLLGDRLIITSITGGYYQYESEFSDQADEKGLVVPAFGPDNHGTKLTFIDIAKPSTPKVTETDTLQGALINQTIERGELFLTLDSPINPPPPSYHLLPQAVPNPYGPGYDRQFETREDYIARLNATPLDQILPHVETVQFFDDYLTHTSRPLVAADAVFAPFTITTTDTHITTVAAFDLTHGHTPDGGPDASISMMGYGAPNFTQDHSIYLLNGNLIGSSNVLKLVPTDTALAPVAMFQSSRVQALQAGNGRLVVAQTNSSTSITLSVLQQNGEQFDVLGSDTFDVHVFGAVKSIALSGNIAAVTFYGATYLSPEFTVAYNIADPGNIALVATNTNLVNV